MYIYITYVHLHNICTFELIFDNIAYFLKKYQKYKLIHLYIHLHLDQKCQSEREMGIYLFCKYIIIFIGLLYCNVQILYRKMFFIGYITTNVHILIYFVKFVST